MRFDADAEVLGRAVERFGLTGNLELGDLFGAQDRIVTLAGLHASPVDLQRGAKLDHMENLHRLRYEQPADGDALPDLVRLGGRVGH